MARAILNNMPSDIGSRTATRSGCSAITELSRRLAPLAGAGFIEEFARAAAEICGADYFIIGRLNTYSNLMRSIHVICDGKIAPNITYSVAGTPCARALDSDTCVYNGDVVERFPSDLQLKEMQIAGYIGTPLRGDDKRPFGIIVAMSRAPFANADDVTAVLDHFRDRVAREVQVLDSLERYRLATEAGTVGLWDWDLLTGDTFVAKSISTMLGYTDDNRSYDLSLIDQAIHVDDHEVRAKALTEHLRNGAPFDIVVRLLCKDGDYRWCRMRANAVREENGAAVRMVGLLSDVHELMTRRSA